MREDVQDQAEALVLIRVKKEPAKEDFNRYATRQ